MSIYLPGWHLLYTRGPPSPRNFLRRTIVQLQRPSPQPALTCDRLEPLLLDCNFVKIHQSLRTTPAMAAGVTERLWEVEDLVGLLE